MPTSSASGPSITATRTGPRLRRRTASCVYNPGFNTNSTIVQEDTQAAYAQVALKFDIGSMASNLVVGARYEETTVTSVNNILVPTAVSWQDDNDFRVERPGVGSETLVRGDGRYHNLLPNLDFDIALTDSMKAPLLVQQDDCSCGLRQLAAGASPRRPWWFDAERLHAERQPRTTLPCSRSSRITSTCRSSTTSRIRATSPWPLSRRTSRTSSVTRSSTKNLYGIRDETGGPRAQAARQELINRGFGTDDSRLFTMMAMMAHPDPSENFWYDLDGDKVQDANELFKGGANNYNDSNDQHVAFATQYDLLPDRSDPL